VAEEDSPKEVQQGDEAGPHGRSFAVLLAAATGLTGALALVLFVVFVGLGLVGNGAPYWAVGVAVVGGIVMRRILLRDPSVMQTVLFSACAIGGALAGLWLAGLLLS